MGIGFGEIGLRPWTVGPYL